MFVFSFILIKPARQKKIFSTVHTVSGLFIRSPCTIVQLAGNPARIYTPCPTDVNIPVNTDQEPPKCWLEHAVVGQ